MPSQRAHSNFFLAFHRTLSATDSPAKQVLTVSRLTQKIQWTLHDSFPDFWVGGEITNLTQPQSGHIYLTLGDEQAQIKGVIWRSTAKRIGFDLQNGMEVVCRGSIDVYPPRGVYQLIIKKIEPQGQGAQQLALKQLHAKLAAEGLFDADRKRPLPRLPKRIGVVTSPTGAAIRDFLQVVSRRWPNLEILILPTRVQGEGAGLEIAAAIRSASQLANPLDVLVVTRGGGSAEDLWCFNDEAIVRAIADCSVPVISGVGHEIDVTLCDVVADVRALTPSEAAELVVPVKLQVIAAIEDLHSRMSAALSNRIDVAEQKLKSLEQRRVLQEPEQLLNVARRNVDEIELRMEQALSRYLERRESEIAVFAGRLNAISPLSVLARGYSVTENEQGDAVKSAGQLAIGDLLRTRLGAGRVESRVTELQDETAFE